jgi:membrane protein CcdC involved in cytochrome C biogenesis
VDIIRTGMFVLAILWVLSQLVITRRKLRTGQVVIPPLFAATLVFLVCILVVAALGASSLHLLWLFLLSFVLGLALVKAARDSANHGKVKRKFTKLLVSLYGLSNVSRNPNPKALQSS